LWWLVAVVAVVITQEGVAVLVVIAQAQPNLLFLDKPIRLRLVLVVAEAQIHNQ